MTKCGNMRQKSCLFKSTEANVVKVYMFHLWPVSGRMSDYQSYRSKIGHLAKIASLWDWVRD